MSVFFSQPFGCSRDYRESSVTSDSHDVSLAMAQAAKDYRATITTNKDTITAWRFDIPS